MKNSLPICAAGWISTPVTARLVYAIKRGASGTLDSQSTCATRCASSAWTPAQPVRISTAPTPRAAGSRSRAEVTSEEISSSVRLSVPIPSIAQKLTVTPGSVRGEERQRHVALAAVRHDHDDPLARHLLAVG